jgi:hypothetical protein
MKETIRLLVSIRHRLRDDEILPQVRELIEVMRRSMDMDLTPPTQRQIVLCMNLVKRYNRLINDFQKKLCNSLTYTQAQRIFGPQANPVSQNWKRVRLPDEVADLLAGMGLRPPG